LVLCFSCWLEEVAAGVFAAAWYADREAADSRIDMASADM
jgi:hypothetical protein